MKPTIGKKIAFGFALALLMIAIIGATTFRSTTKLIEAAGWSEHTSEVITSLEGLPSNLKDAETGQRGFLITGEERYLEPYNQSKVSVKADLQNLRMLTADNPNQQRRLDSLEPLIADKYTELDQERRVGKECR